MKGQMTWIYQRCSLLRSRYILFRFGSRKYVTTNTLPITDYRRTEFAADKSYKNNGGSAVDHQATQSLLEINTNLNKNTSVNRTPEPLTPKLMHYDSAMPSPFIDKKLAVNTPQLKPRAISPHSEEHQYDIPFGHLNKSNHQKSRTGVPASVVPPPADHYDDLEVSRQNRIQQQQRKSRTSNRTSSGTSHSKFGNNKVLLHWWTKEVFSWQILG